MDNKSLSEFLDQRDAAIRKAERERCISALAEHYGFTDDEKRVACDVLRKLEN
jgi:hypothetical protein